MQPVNPYYAARIRPHKPNPRSPTRFNVLDLFSGIGGFSLGFERAGMRTAAFCEINPYCREVLARHWPDAPIYDDITTLTARRLHHDNIEPIDLISGGYPCQPFSIAGKQRGERDPRHLWPEMYRLIREVGPRWVVCENVAGHVQLGLDAVLADLDAAGYAATPFIIPACAVGAPHRRDRVWIVAHTVGLGEQTHQRPLERQPFDQLPAASLRWDLPQPFTVGSDDGIPDRMERTQGLGNAVVPQVPELIGQAIHAYEAGMHNAR